MLTRLLLLCFSLSISPAMAAAKYSTPIEAGARSFVVDLSPLDKKSAPQVTAVVPGTNFIVIQSQGGSILLGPLLSVASIKAKATSLAKSANGGYFGVNVGTIAQQALAKLDLPDVPSAPAYTIKPVAFVQQCPLDKKYRAAFAFQVTSPGGKKGWMGRYIAHLALAIPYAGFMNPTAEEIASFTEMMTDAAIRAATLMARDLRGELSASGHLVGVSSLHFYGNYYGSRDKRILYTSQLIDDKNGRLVVRMPTVRQSWLYGVNEIDRSLIEIYSEIAVPAK
jgi:hypothetical protein